MLNVSPALPEEDFKHIMDADTLSSHLARLQAFSLILLVGMEIPIYAFHQFLSISEGCMNPTLKPPCQHPTFKSLSIVVNLFPWRHDMVKYSMGKKLGSVDLNTISKSSLILALHGKIRKGNFTG